MVKNNVKRKALKAKSLEIKYGTPNNKVIYPSAGHLERIFCDGETDGTVQFFDGQRLIFEVNKKMLRAGVLANMELVSKKGIAWAIPLYEYAVELDYAVEHQLIVIGDVEGIILWIDGKVLG